MSFKPVKGSEAVVTIVVPPPLASLVSELAERMARVLGQDTISTRRAVEQSILSSGCRVVQSDIVELENQAERMGWLR